MEDETKHKNQHFFPQDKILVSRSYKKVVSVYEDMDDDRRVALTASLDNWNLPESRKRFVEIFEERVVRPS